MPETIPMPVLLYYITAGTMPFHLFAYIPFWNDLRLPKKITSVILLAEQLLFTGIFSLLYHMGLSMASAQLSAAPLYGCLFFYLVNKEPGKVAFLYIFTADYVMLIKGAASFISHSLMHFQPVSWQSGTLIVLLFFITMPLILHYINNTAEIIFSIDAPAIWKTVWLLPLFNSLIVLLFTYPADTGKVLTLITRTLLIICMFLIYHFLIRSIRQIQTQAVTEERSRSMETLMKLQAYQYTLIQSKIEETRQARHDLRHHWKALYGYVEDNDFDALSAYIKKCCENFPQESYAVFCDSPGVNAILHFYAEKAARHQIETEISFAAKNIPVIPEPELCVLLGNLLENALEACMSCEEKRFIRVNAKLMGKQTLILTVDNTGARPAMEGDAFYSSKRDGFGIGTESVRVIVKRYHGDIRYEWKDGVFYASVMLNP